MENTHKQLTALNTDSVRTLINMINEMGIQKDDILKIICEQDSYYLLYYENCD